MTVDHPVYGTRCEVCFGRLTASTCAVDEHGARWDVCAGDCARQAGIPEKIHRDTPGPAK